MKRKFNDIIDPKLKFELVESNAVDGEHILAKVRGVFFCPNGKSRNGRFYEKALWENVLSNPAVNERLQNRNMFGTVGHETTLDDKAVLEGLVSHIVTHLEINENDEGIGEALILNTPAGQTLNTILRAGGKMYVSTRANGTLKGKTSEGLPIVDKDTYDFQTVDFVCRPGFLEANPSLAENLNKLIEDNKGNGEVMNEQLIKLITDENADLKNKVGSLTDEVTALTEEKVTLAEENTHMTGEVAKLEEANALIAKFSELGTVEEISEAIVNLGTATDRLCGFNELGESVSSIKKALEISYSHMSETNEKFGSLEKIEKALTLAVDFKCEIDGIGTVDEIRETFSEKEKIEEEKAQLEKDNKSKELAEELGLPVEKVNSLLEKFSEEDIKELHGEVSESTTKRFKKQVITEDEDETLNEDEDDSVELYESTILSKKTYRS